MKQISLGLMILTLAIGSLNCAGGEQREPKVTSPPAAPTSVNNNGAPNDVTPATNSGPAGVRNDTSSRERVDGDDQTNANRSALAGNSRRNADDRNRNSRSDDHERRESREDRDDDDRPRN